MKKLSLLLFLLFTVSNNIQSMELLESEEEITLPEETTGPWYLVASVKHPSWLHSIVFHPTKNLFLIASQDNYAALWDVKDVKGELAKYRVKFPHKGPVTSIKFSPNGKYVLTGSVDRTAVLWDLEGKKLVQFSHNSPVKSVEFSSDGKSVLTALENGTVALWNLEGKRLKIFPHKGYVRSVDFRFDGKKVLTALEDGYALLWDVKSELQEYEVLFPHSGLATFQHKGPVTLVKFSSDGKYVLTGSEDNTAALWDLEGKKLATFPHNRLFKSSGFSPEGKKVLIASVDGTVALWNLKGERLETFNHEQGARSAIFNFAGDRILTNLWGFGKFAGFTLWELRYRKPQYQVLHYKQYMQLRNGNSIGWIWDKDASEKVLINLRKNKEPTIDQTGQANFLYINPDMPSAKLPKGLYYWSKQGKNPKVGDCRRKTLVRHHSHGKNFIHSGGRLDHYVNAWHKDIKWDVKRIKEQHPF